MAAVSAWQTIQGLFLRDEAPMQSGGGRERRGTTSNQQRAYQAYVEEEHGEARSKADTTEDVDESGNQICDELSEERKNELDARAKAATQSSIEADVIIAIMGITGTGKSTFISLLTNGSAKVGHSLSSCTSDVGIHGFRSSDGVKIALIDTPGFDDTYRSDSEVLQDVAYFLGQVYEKGLKLAGIIYLQKITDNRMQGSVLKNLEMFQALCGDSGLSNVVLATTMWDQARTLEEQGKAERREEELRTNPKYWADMLELGSQTFRHDNSVASASKIIEYILQLPTTVILKIQQEMVDEKRSLNQTVAGKRLQKDLLAQEEKHNAALKKIQTEHRKAIESGNKKTAKMFERMQREHTENLKKAEKEKENIRKDFRCLQEEGDKKYRAMLRQLELEREEIETKAKEKEEEVENMLREQRNINEKLEEIERGRDRDRKQWQAKLEGQAKANANQIAQIKVDADKYREQAVALQNQINSSSASSIIRALAGVSMIGAGVMFGQPTLVATGGGVIGGI